MKRKCLAVVIILLFIETSTTPLIAQNIGKSSLLKDNSKNLEKTENIGKIYGQTIWGGWAGGPLSNVIVRIGLRITRSDSNGYFEISGLPINRTYRVVANHLSYMRTVEKVTLTSEKPEKMIYIHMDFFIDFIFDIIFDILFPSKLSLS
jgi:hypothetical protein